MISKNDKEANKMLKKNSIKNTKKEEQEKDCVEEKEPKKDKHGITRLYPTQEEMEELDKETIEAIGP